MGTRSEVGDTFLWNTVQRRKLKSEFLEAVPADNYAIQADYPPVLIFTPAGAIDVLMPAAGVETKGLMFFIHNQGAGGIITLKTSGDAAFSPAITIATNVGHLVICNGVTWRKVM